VQPACTREKENERQCRPDDRRVPVGVGHEGRKSVGAGDEFEVNRLASS
jgi:hypothetical protein